MPVDRTLNHDGESSASRSSLVWTIPIALLVAVWVWLVFSSGGYAPRNWIFPAFALGLGGLIVAVLLAYPRRPRQLSLAVLTPAAAYSVWVLLSGLWAGSGQAAWLASGRIFTYLLVLALALTYFTSGRARSAFRYLILLAAFVLLIVPISRLWETSDIARLFSGGRLTYPAGDPESTAALFLILFWPLLWLAAGRGERAPMRGAALGIATGLVGLTVMTQSRAATWSMALTLILLFILSPGRLRLLFYLVVPGILMVYGYPQLNRYWTMGPPAVGGASGARVVLVMAIAAGFMGTVLALLEGWIKVTGRMKAIFGAVVAAACIAALVYGGLTLTRDVGGPVSWFQEAWQRLAAERVDYPQAQSSSLVQGERPSRQNLWTLGWQQFQDRPAVGAGADNAGIGLVTTGNTGQGSAAAGDPGAGSTLVDPPASTEPASISTSFAVQVLGDTGIIGGILAFGAILVAIVGMLWPRFVAGWRHRRWAWQKDPEPRLEEGRPQGRDRWGHKPQEYGWQMALFAGTAFWFFYANIAWLWQTTSVTIPALLMLAAAIAATDAQAGTLWPRLRLPRFSAVLGPESAGHGIEAGGHSPASALGSAPADTPRPASHSKPRGISSRLRPPGPLSQAFRVALIVVSAVVVILAGTAYLLVVL